MDKKKRLKNNRFDFYRLFGFFVIIAVAMITSRYSRLDDKIQLLFTDVFSHSRPEYLLDPSAYNSLLVFAYVFFDGFLYLALALPAISCMMRYCDELNSGYSKFIVARIGNSRYIGKTVLRTIATAFIVTFAALYTLFLIFYFRLPNINEALALADDPALYIGIHDLGDFRANGLLYVLRYIIPSSLVACVAGLLSILVATISRNKFLSLTIPLLLIEAEDSICGGSMDINIFKYRVSGLLFPFDEYTPQFTWWSFGLLILTVAVVLTTLIYVLSGRRCKHGE